MKPSTIDAMQDLYRETQSLILHVIDRLEPGQWASRSPTVDAPIAFHAWHIAREADILHTFILHAMNKPAEQIWHRDQLARRWSFSPRSLGLLESGIGMDENDAARIPWPSRDELVAYLHRSFDAANDAIASLDPDTVRVVFTTPASAVFGGAGTVERAIMRAIANGNRHLGVIGWISTTLDADRFVRQPTWSADQHVRQHIAAEHPAP